MVCGDPQTPALSFGKKEMPVKRKKNTYFFSAVVKRGVVRVSREGGINANSPGEAMDEIERIADNEWSLPLVRCDLYEVGLGGELGEKVLTLLEDISLTNNALILPQPSKKQQTPSMKPSETNYSEKKGPLLGTEYFAKKTNFPTFLP